MIKAKLSIELDDAIVLLVGSDIKGWRHPTKIEGITRLEKLIFLLSKETQMGASLVQDLEFEPAPFGPFSAELYQTVDSLLAAQILEERNTVTRENVDSWEAQNLIGLEDSAFLMRNFTLSARGQRYYDAITRDVDNKTLEEISLFKNRFAFLPIRKLIRYIYSQYPQYTISNS